MVVEQFSRDAMANWYAERHIRTDPGIREVYYLPTGAPDREIRFVEINDMMADRENDLLEPLDFGLDAEGSSAHRLIVLDVTPEQWDRIQRCELSLPRNWTLANAIRIPRE